MEEKVLIYMRGNNSIRDYVWELLRRELIECADAVTRFEAFLKDGNKGKLSTNQDCMIVIAKRAHLDEIMGYLRVEADIDFSAYVVPVLASF